MHRWVDHTGELELEIEAASEEAVFGDALAALGELLGERGEPTSGEAVVHEVHAAAPDRATLLAEWVNELIYLAESLGFVPERVERLELTENALEATVSGRRGLGSRRVHSRRGIG